METKNPVVTDSAVSVGTSEPRLLVEDFVEEHYMLRRNVLNGLTEYRKVEEEDKDFRPLTTSALNSIILLAKREMGEDVDIKGDLKLYVDSDDIPVHDPINDYLGNLPEWDHTDRIVDFWKRIPGLNAEMIFYLTLWLHYTVACWCGINKEHGNEGTPVLIGDQGCGKSTFWIRFLPEHLRQYYLDHFNLANKFDKEMALSNCLLVNLDEMDQYKPGQMAELKQALSKVKVNGRRIYGRTIDDRRRYASFVGTTNNRHPLMDPTGSRRYICVAIPSGSVIDNDTEIDYDQLFAQLVYELKEEKVRYWFTNEETKRIQQLNTKFEQQLDLEQILSIYYAKPEEGEEAETTKITTREIRNTLKLQYPNISEQKFSSEKIGRTLTEMNFEKTKTKHGMVYSVVPKKTA